MEEKHLLITGFEPFGGQTVNPSWEAVARLPEAVGCVRLHKLRVPTVFGAAAELVLAEAAHLRPDGILCVGQAGGRDAVTPEYVAINLRHARIPDNAGAQPTDEPVVPGGPAAYFSTFPLRRMVEAAEAAGVPCRCSYTAGTFVCNELLYRVLHATAGTAAQAGFIHVPYLPEQAGPGQFALPLEDMVRALEAAVAAWWQA